jgi:hypothetical protein
VNISGHLRLDWLLGPIRRKAFIDEDPGFTQFWLDSGIGRDVIARHDVHFTVGENIGTARCAIPTAAVRWLPLRPFAVLDQWPPSPQGPPDRFTTVASWRGPYGAVEHGGRRYGLKAHEFRKMMALPQLASATFELALDIDAADAGDRQTLEQHGWRLVDPQIVAGDPLRFRRYVQASGSEFSVAKGVYVETDSGWFSDRTVCYLASGKPVLVQDTGFSRQYPVGAGLLTFRTVDEAAAGAEEIVRNHGAHCHAAREIAETYFDSDIVLSRFLDEALSGA